MNNLNNPILVWRFEDAPDGYKFLSPHGGDEDWLAFVPTGISEPLWLANGTSFGCCSVSETPVTGGTIYIGAHA